MPGAPAPEEGEVHVCLSSTCRSRGSEAVLAEIEELAAGAPCGVEASGCLGYCRRGPAAAVVLPAGDEDPSDPNPPRATVVFTRLNKLEDSRRAGLRVLVGNYLPVRLRTHSNRLSHRNEVLEKL